MARGPAKYAINSIKARHGLKKRREPYWQFLEQGRSLGFRKGARGGTWIARLYDPKQGRRDYHALGDADGYEGKEADGVGILNHAQALKLARDWFGEKDKESGAGVKRGPYSVADAFADYVAHLEREGAPAKSRVVSTWRVNIEPTLGSIELRNLTKNQVQNWLHNVASSRPMVRGSAGQPSRSGKAVSGSEAKRKRRNTANTELRILRAALNFAHTEHRAASTVAWSTVAPLSNAASESPSPIKEEDIAHLVNACSAEFRPLVQAAIFTGLRYSEITALKCRDFNADSGSLKVRRSKSGKERSVWLTDEAQQFFASAVLGKPLEGLIFTKANGSSWGASHQQRPLKLACERAKLSQVSFHKLRHTYASLLAVKGVPMAMIAKQLGHADSRITERTYAGIAEDYVARAVREAMPTLGINKQNNVVAIKRKSK